MHQSYEDKLGHPCDFRVKYKFYSPEEGGRKMLPYQGIRSDFWYDNQNAKDQGLFMIWPEFEDESGELITYNDRSVPKEGTARMWIIVPERRPVHIDQLIVGTKAYFMEGHMRTAECEVIELVGLKTNPQG